MSNKTVLQQLVEDLQKCTETISRDNVIYHIQTKCIPAEKQMIMDAYWTGMCDGKIGSKNCCETYYTQTFKTT